MTIDEMIAVLQAAKAGKQIQFKQRLQSCRESEWMDCKTIECVWDEHVFRVKPEPREWWIHDERRTALSYNPGNGWTHVREVL